MTETDKGDHTVKSIQSPSSLYTQLLQVVPELEEAGQSHIVMAAKDFLNLHIIVRERRGVMIEITLAHYEWSFMDNCQHTRPSMDLLLYPDSRQVRVLCVQDSGVTEQAYYWNNDSQQFTQVSLLVEERLEAFLASWLGVIIEAGFSEISRRK